MAEVFRTGVVGVGYVGLATAACHSHLGHSVLCVDTDEERTRALEEGRVPFYEPGLEDLISRGIHAERLSFAGPDGLSRLVGETDVVFIAVDTPQGEDGSADLSNVGAVARSIGRALAEAGPARGRPLIVSHGGPEGARGRAQHPRPRRGPRSRPPLQGLRAWLARGGRS